MASLDINPLQQSTMLNNNTNTIDNNNINIADNILATPNVITININEPNIDGKNNNNNNNNGRIVSGNDNSASNNNNTNLTISPNKLPIIRSSNVVESSPVLNLIE